MESFGYWTIISFVIGNSVNYLYRPSFNCLSRFTHFLPRLAFIAFIRTYARLVSIHAHRTCNFTDVTSQCHLPRRSECRRGLRRDSVSNFIKAIDGVAMRMRMRRFNIFASTKRVAALGNDDWGTSLYARWRKRLRRGWRTRSSLRTDTKTVLAWACRYAIKALKAVLRPLLAERKMNWEQRAWPGLTGRDRSLFSFLPLCGI